jgi:hypothetical protein
MSHQAPDRSKRRSSRSGAALRDCGLSGDTRHSKPTESFPRREGMSIAHRSSRARTLSGLTGAPMSLDVLRSVASPLITSLARLAQAAEQTPAATQPPAARAGLQISDGFDDAQPATRAAQVRTSAAQTASAPQGAQAEASAASGQSAASQNPLQQFLSVFTNMLQKLFSSLLGGAAGQGQGQGGEGQNQGGSEDAGGSRSRRRCASDAGRCCPQPATDRRGRRRQRRTGRGPGRRGERRPLRGQRPAYERRGWRGWHPGIRGVAGP